MHGITVLKKIWISNNISMIYIDVIIYLSVILMFVQLISAGNRCPKDLQVQLWLCVWSLYTIGTWSVEIHLAHSLITCQFWNYHHEKCFILLIVPARTYTTHHSCGFPKSPSWCGPPQKPSSPTNPVFRWRNQWSTVMQVSLLIPSIASWCQWSGSHFTNNLWAYDWKLMKIFWI